MPSPFIINGRPYYGERAVSRTDWSKMNGSAQATKGVVALLIEGSVGGEAATGHECVTQTSLKALLAEPDATYLAKALFAPSKQRDRVPSGASRVIHVRVNPATLASLTLDDSDAAPVVTAFDKEYGAVGNDTRVTVEDGTNQGLKVTVVRGADTEVLDDVGAMDAMILTYTPYASPYDQEFDLNAMLAEISSGGISITWDVYHADNSVWDFSAAGAALPVSGSVAIKLIHTEPGDRAFVVHGVNKATGQAISETVTFASGIDTEKSTTHEFSSITQIEIPNLTASENLDKAQFVVDAFYLPVAQYDTISKVASKVNAASAMGFSAALATTNTGFLVANLDTAHNVDIVDGAEVTASLYSFITNCNRYFSLVTFADADGQTQRDLPDPIGETALTGGQDNLSDSGTKIANWQAALDELAKWPVDQVLMMTDDPALWDLGLTHCAYYWGEGGFERSLWVGTPARTPLLANGQDGTLYALSRGLNSELASLCCQEIKVYDNTGTAQWVPPMYAAAYGCGMEAGRVMQDSIMRARPDIIDVRDNPKDAVGPWSVTNNSEQLIEHGYFLLEKPIRGGIIRWKRDVTTYQDATENNPIKSSRFGMTQHGLSVRDVRFYLEDVIGTGNWAGTANDIKSETQARLAKQVGVLIKDFDPKSVVAIDHGDGFSVEWDEEPAEAIGWVECVAHPQRRAA